MVQAKFIRSLLAVSLCFSLLLTLLAGTAMAKKKEQSQEREKLSLFLTIIGLYLMWKQRIPFVS